MAALSIRDLDDGVRDRLRVRAAQNGRSMEAEAREILAAAVPEQGRTGNFLTAWRDAFAEVGGVDLDIPPRTEMPRPVDLP